VQKHKNILGTNLFSIIELYSLIFLDLYAGTTIIIGHTPSTADMGLSNGSL